MRDYVPSYINQVYLMLTEYCPMRCDYCYIRDRENNSPMPLEVAAKALAMFGNRPLKVIFFGGEPLTQLELLQKIFNQYASRNRFQVITSGLANFEVFFDFYKKNHGNLDLQISWDGVGATRLTKQGNNLQSQVMDNIIRIGAEGLGVQVRSVINDLNVASFFDTYMYFRDLKRSYRITGDFTIAHQTSFSDSFAEHLTWQLKLILTVVKKDLWEKQKAYVPQNIMKMLHSIITGAKGSSCDTGNYVVIRPNGDIYPCSILSQIDSQMFCCGNVKDARTIDFEIIDKLRQIPDSCHTCNYRCICDGGCRYERYANFAAWEQTVCSFACTNTEAMYKTLAEWLAEMQKEQLQGLVSMLTDYSGWIIKDYISATDEQCMRNKFIEKW